MRLLVRLKRLISRIFRRDEATTALLSFDQLFAELEVTSRRVVAEEIRRYGLR
jgi:hypothetical protein